MGDALRVSRARGRPELRTEGGACVYALRAAADRSRTATPLTGTRRRFFGPLNPGTEAARPPKGRRRKKKGYEWRGTVCGDDGMGST